MARKDENNRIKDDRFPPALFAIMLGVLLLMSGIHMGLLILMEDLNSPDVVSVFVPIIYWAAVAVGLTLFTRGKIRRTYERPLHEIAKATSKVSAGDFSVYVPTINTADKLDYLDVMIMDFNKMVEELGSIETLKTDFISNVSHEMKTPIAIIKNYAELIRNPQISEEQKIEYSSNIEEAAARLSNLISNILKLNKLENQNIPVEIEQYDLCRQLEECILQFEDVWEKKNIDIDIDIDENIMIMADMGLMELVWNNLISNAMKYTEPGGTVSISQTKENGLIKTTVTDSGCGISRESINHIFDKFYQADTSHSGEGNGLGLALVVRILDLMNGDVQVESEVGIGSSFTVTLPMADGFKEK